PVVNLDLQLAHPDQAGGPQLPAAVDHRAVGPCPHRAVLAVGPPVPAAAPPPRPGRPLSGAGRGFPEPVPRPFGVDRHACTPSRRGWGRMHRPGTRRGFATIREKWLGVQSGSTRWNTRSTVWNTCREDGWSKTRWGATPHPGPDALASD